jgi:hypothetical protein
LTGYESLGKNVVAAPQHLFNVPGPERLLAVSTHVGIDVLLSLTGWVVPRDNQIVSPTNVNLLAEVTAIVEIP